MNDQTKSASKKGGIWRWILRHESRRSVTIVWTVVFVLLLALLVGPILFGGNSRPRDDVSAAAAIPNLKGMVQLSTPVEREWIQKLSLVREPLAPNVPPAQSAPARAQNLVFGVTDGAAFNTATRLLNGLGPACSGTLPIDAVQLKLARDKIYQLTNAGNSNRALFHYHQGLVELCEGNHAQADAEFKQAQETIDTYKKDSRASFEKNKLIVGQYEAVNGYGRGLAMIGQYQLPKHPSVSDIDRVLMQAKVAAQSGAAADQPGPFTEFSYAGSSRRLVRDLFEFSTADIDNARVYLGLISGEPELGLEDRDPMPTARRTALGSAGSYAIGNPQLTANLAAAAAASGDIVTVDDLYGRFSAGMSSGALTGAWHNSPDAQMRLAQLAVTGSQDLVSDSSAVWWPRPAGGASRVRTTFLATGFDVPFAPVAEAGDDAEILDMWLWVRRERLLLQTGQFRFFVDDGDKIRNLNPQTKDFMLTWRSQATRALGGELLKHANMVRKRDGFAAADDLYRLLSRPGFPFAIQSRARLAHVYHSPPWLILTILGGLGLFLGFLAWTHREIRLGQRRTFTRRHHLERLAKGG